METRSKRSAALGRPPGGAPSAKRGRHRCTAAAGPPAPPSTSAPSTSTWVRKAAEAVESIAWNIPAFNRHSNYLNVVEETVPDADFQFTVWKDNYHFEFTDGRDDTDGDGLSILTGNWDGNYGISYEHGWDLLPFFRVTVTQVNFRITIKACLTTSPLELADYLLENNISVEHLDQ